MPQATTKGRHGTRRDRRSLIPWRIQSVKAGRSHLFLSYGVQWNVSGGSRGVMVFGVLGRDAS